MNIDNNSIIAYLACIFFLFIFGKLFIVPLKTIIKLILNSLLGGIAIFIVNIIGSAFNFHIGLNIITSVIIGLLGIPGTIVIILIKILLK